MPGVDQQGGHGDLGQRGGGDGEPDQQELERPGEDQRGEDAGLRRVKRLEDAGIIAGYRAVIDRAAVGRGLEVFVDLEVQATDLKTIEDLEATVASYDEVIELCRMFGRPDYFIRVAVADHAAYEVFQTSKLLGLPGVLRTTSHLTLKKIKTGD